jgi:hypothetical protein
MNDMKEIKLINSPLTAKVDDEWFDRLSQCKWRLTQKGYAYRAGLFSKGAMMHRIVNMTPDGFQTDHINNDKLDNRSANLQSCTNAENCRKRTRKAPPKSGFRGVRQKNSRFEVAITVNYKKHYLGMFNTAEEAARAYDARAIELHGSFANLNFPELTTKQTHDE